MLPVDVVPDPARDAFFERDGHRYIASEWTRGPWSPMHQHAGPPAGLLARAIEELVGSSTPGPMRVARLTFEIVRPIPIGALVVDTRIVRAGRKAVWATAEASSDDAVCMRAAAVCIREAVVAVPPGADEPPPRSLESSPPWAFPFFREKRSYDGAMELRIARGTFGHGAMAAWMRMRIPLVAGEAPSPVVRVAVAADSGNGVSVGLDVTHFTFVNPDLTIHLLRPPATDWVCLDATTRWDAAGIGQAESVLYDERGRIGASHQSLVVESR